MEVVIKKWKNDITQIFDTEYPIVQAPMFGVTTPQMVSSTVEAGAFGSLPLGDLPADKCAERIRATRQLTDRPFATNIFLNDLPEQNEDLKQRYNRTKKFLQSLTAEYGLQVDFPSYDDIVLTDYRDQIDAMIAEECKIVSFTFGVLDPLSIEKLKHIGTILIGTATSVEEAILLEKVGIDIVCVQGYEAGGHRGSFLGSNVPDIGGLSLLAQVKDNVNVPLIYAGGIYDAKTLLAANTLGAQGFQIGSLLLGSLESGFQWFEKEKLRESAELDVVMTKSFSGRYARGLRNKFIDALENTDYILPYPYQNKITAPLREVAKQHKNTEFLSIWTGHSRSRYSEASTKDIILKLIREVEKYSSK